MEHFMIDCRSSYFTGAETKWRLSRLLIEVYPKLEREMRPLVLPS